MRPITQKIIFFAFFMAAIGFFVSWITPRAFYRVNYENDFIKTLKAKLAEWNQELPEDRVYVHLDKPMYQPGETVWFSAYLRNGADLRPSTKSDIIHVELISPKGSTESHIKLVGKNGQAAGDFQIGSEMPGGIYKIKAYTNWQKNEKPEVFFEKEFQVQQYILPTLKMKLDFQRKAFGAGDEVLIKIDFNTNENKPLSKYKFRYVASLGGQKYLEKSGETDGEGTGYIRFKLPKDLKTTDGLINVLTDYMGSTESISRSIPIVLNKINFTMYPEGGDLVSGIASRVAFRALNEFNKPADVEGIIVTEDGKQITSFSSFHMGMGAFEMKPEAGKKYFAKITKPEGIRETFELPEIYARGYVLNAGQVKEGELPLTVKTTEKEELSLVLQMRSKIYFTTAFTAEGGEQKISVPVKNLPAGVAQATLFDRKGVARAERLVFLNKDRQLSISIKTDKEKYLPREKVVMTVSVKDERGIPTPASLSLSVTNDQLLSFADDRSGNMLSKLLLEEDIKGKIEEPAFYFDNKEPKSDQALDYLLMTSGWRRFTWEQIANGPLPALQHQAEQAVIAGVLIDYPKNKPVAKARISAGGQSVLTDEQGKFILKNIDPDFPLTLQFTASGYNQGSQQLYEYTNNLTLRAYKPDYFMHLNNHLYPSVAVNEDAGGFNKKVPRANAAEVPAVQEKAAKPEVRKEVKANNDINPEKEVEVAIRVEDDRLAGVILRKPAVANENGYYRARQFAAPVYDKQETVEERTDFRSTIYWNGQVEIDKTGRKTIEFYNSDDITSFRATVEGISTEGLAGRCEKTFFTQLPFALSTKVPVEVTAGDIISIPLTLRNNTDGPLGGFLKISAPAGLQAMNEIAEGQTIMPGKAKIIYLDYKVSPHALPGEFKISFKSCGLADAFAQKIKIVSRGFPVTASFSGQAIDKEFSLELNNIVEGSLSAILTAYPNVTGDLLSAVEGILREPGGCFEQTSMSSYPNAMVLDYLKTTDSKDDKTLARATALLDKGYNRLITFETKDKGYEWFGAAPGHEALTAYGLMQFADMKKVGANINQGMMDRTAKWLMSRKDGKGGYLRNSRALDSFGRGSEDITNAYITYALAEAGYKDIVKETDHSYQKAIESNDSYMLALMANTMYNTGDIKRGDKLVDLLCNMQDKNGSWTGKTHSITNSTGQSLTIETTSLAIMAILKNSNRNNNALTKAVQFLVSSRSGHGTFGNTQGTVLALKALTEYAKAMKKTSSAGTIELYVNGKKVAEKRYEADQQGNIEIRGIEKYLLDGKQKIRIKFKGTKEALPYAIAVNYNTSLPNSARECAIQLTTRMGAKSAATGETVRLSVSLKNIRNEAVPNPIAIIGIPAGFTVQPWQLKELQEKSVFDYYEVIGNNIILYYRGMKATEIKNIDFDLKAEIPGEYEAPASSAYLYYTNEHKSWTALERITVRKN